ncbi:hypothetical protein AAHC03_09142 [Spirometra sp. Aus1]
MHIKVKVTHLKAKHDLASSQLDEAKLELSALDGELCDANDVIESYKEEILKLESENERLLEVSQEVQTACEAFQSERKTLEGRITHFEERCPRIEEEVSDAEWQKHSRERTHDGDGEAGAKTEVAVCPSSISLHQFGLSLAYGACMLACLAGCPALTSPHILLDLRFERD